MKLLKFFSIFIISAVMCTSCFLFGCAVIPVDNAEELTGEYTAIFYEEDGVTVFYQVKLTKHSPLAAPVGNPEDLENRKEFLGWGVFNGESYSETPFDFDGLTNGIVENM